MRAFFKNVPKDLGDAARVDGASEVQIFLQIFLPLARPGLMTVALLEFLWSWNELLLPLVFLITDERRTLPVGMLFYQGRFTVDYGLMCAGVLILSVPITILFLIFQRDFVNGMTAGGSRASTTAESRRTQREGEISMRRSQVTAPGTSEVVEVDVREPGPGEVLVRVRLCGVCASELPLWRDAGRDVPFRLGHEPFGIVEAVGPEVMQFSPGDRVTGLFKEAYSEYCTVPADIMPPRACRTYLASPGQCRQRRTRN